MNRRLVAPLVLLLLISGWAEAHPSRYIVQVGAGTRVTFTSKATLESFAGKTGVVSGWCAADLDSLAAEVEFEVAVDLGSFDTGLSKRNRHMRENHLETDRYPQAWFRGGSIKGQRTALPGGGTVTFTLRGELDLHGVTRPLICDVTVRDLGDGRVQVDAEFPVKLSDHAISRPRFLVMKLGDEQQVHVLLELKEQP